MPAPSREQVVDTLRQFIVGEFLPGENPGALLETTPLYDTGILDSIATLKLVAFVEEQFGITVEAHEASARFDTVGGIADLVVAKSR